MHFGKILIIIGLILVLAGLLYLYGSKIPFLGKLPGDIRIERENFSFYLPVGTCLLISALLSLILWLFKR
jgi:thiosulfate reductase cytochrome b subunit